MKKSALLLAAALLAFSLTACGKNAGQDEGRDETVQEPVVSAEPAEEVQEEELFSEVNVTEDTKSDTAPADAGDTDEGDSMEDQEKTETEGGKTLVVYFSATGNTEEAAGHIAEATGGDLFELVPAEPYSDEDLNYNNENSRVVYEYENPEARATELVEATVADWDSYDTVFIGYPIWWRAAAWPVDGFIAANDFTGKTVIPFCTSGSSGLGESGRLLAEAAGTGDWQEGGRFDSDDVSEETVKAWVESLGLE